MSAPTAVLRRKWSDALSAAPGIDSVAVAPTIHLAWTRAVNDNADVIVIVARGDARPSLPTEGERTAPTAIEVLVGPVAGERPSNSILVDDPNPVPEVVDRIRAIIVRGATTQFAPVAAPAEESPRSPSVTSPLSVVVIGVSTGGPPVLTTLLGRITKPLPVPVVIVQHMPEGFIDGLASRLSASSGHEIRVATDGEILSPGDVVLAPGGRHLCVSWQSGAAIETRLTDGPPEHSCRPSVNPLFRSASAGGPSVLGIVLTGMGDDGIEGARAVVDAGGTILAQSEASSVVWGMPGAVVEAGLASEIADPAGLADAVDARLEIQQLLSRANTGGRQ